jgi:hypothetical protein
MQIIEKKTMCQESFPLRGIVDDLEAALEQFRLIANDLGEGAPN